MNADPVVPRRAGSGRSGPVERRRRARRAVAALAVTAVAGGLVYVNSVGDDQPGASALSGELDAVDDAGTTPIGTPILVDVVANDTGDVDPSTITLIDPPAHGIITGVDPTTGVIAYEPEAGYTGSDSFTYSLDETPGTAFDVRPLATGTDGTTTIGRDEPDPYWRIAETVDDPGQPALGVAGWGGGGWAPPPAGAAWICGAACSTARDDTAVFHRSFEIPDAHTAENAVLTFDVYADDVIDEVWVNGEALGERTTSNTYSAGRAHRLVIDAADVTLVPGTNTLSIQVRNTGAGPMGLLVAPSTGDSDGDGVPDHADRCLGTPAGATVNGEGCRRELATVSIEITGAATSTTTTTTTPSTTSSTTTTTPSTTSSTTTTTPSTTSSTTTTTPSTTST
ncbi:MAG: hypothetical protein D6683_15605, partial [Actinomyces sp.]